MAHFQTGLPASGALSLLHCGLCDEVSYPSRELCGSCLADDLHWRLVADTGVVQSITELQYSLEPVYSTQLPWTVASIKLDCGPVAIAHLAPGVAINDAVELKAMQDDTGNNMLVALGRSEATQAAAISWLAEIQFKEIST